MADIQILKELMAQQETESAEGYLIPCDMIEEMESQPKGKLFSELMVEKGFLLVSRRLKDDV